MRHPADVVTDILQIVAVPSEAVAGSKAIIEADRRAAKLEALGEAYQRIESGVRWDGVLDQMMIELAAQEKP